MPKLTDQLNNLVYLDEKEFVDLEVDLSQIHSTNWICVTSRKDFILLLQTNRRFEDINRLEIHGSIKIKLGAILNGKDVENLIGTFNLVDGTPKKLVFEQNKTNEESAN